jgi:hypothetical protein
VKKQVLGSRQIEPAVCWEIYVCPKCDKTEIKPVGPCKGPNEFMHHGPTDWLKIQVTPYEQIKATENRWRTERNQRIDAEHALRHSEERANELELELEALEGARQ